MLAPSPLPELILCEDLALRRTVVEDAKEAFLLIDSERDRLREFLPWVDEIKTINDEIFALRGLTKKWDGCEAFNYFIRESKGNLIGSLSAHSIDWTNRSAQIGYWLASSRVGCGDIQRAIRGLEPLLFEMGFIRLEIRTRGTNTRSIRTAELSGFQCEGVLRSDVVVRGEHCDTVIFAKIMAKV